MDESFDACMVPGLPLKLAQDPGALSHGPDSFLALSNLPLSAQALTLPVCSSSTDNLAAEIPEKTEATSCSQPQILMNSMCAIPLSEERLPSSSKNPFSCLHPSCSSNRNFYFPIVRFFLLPLSPRPTWSSPSSNKVTQSPPLAPFTSSYTVFLPSQPRC